MPRHVTDNDKTPLIDVLTLMFMVIAILACIVRSSTKLYMIKALKMDDILAVIATVRYEAFTPVGLFPIDYFLVLVQAVATKLPPRQSLPDPCATVPGFARGCITCSKC